MKMLCLPKAIATTIFIDRDQCHGGNGKLVVRTKNSKSKTRYV
ncbi:hypothetical protein [Pseudanabaena yagii]|nr:hypothetical protein [Pseudanabaena yagii]